jgi:hypothetical protein
MRGIVSRRDLTIDGSGSKGSPGALTLAESALFPIVVDVRCDFFAARSS